MKANMQTSCGGRGRTQHWAVNALQHADKGAKTPAHSSAVHTKAAHDCKIEVGLQMG
jgi:hypothetical protein